MPGAYRRRRVRTVLASVVEAIVAVGGILIASSADLV
jgi:hypothetical protein